MKAAAEHDVVTQLGNQGHSFGDIRRFCEWVWDGAIGQVHTVHAGCNNSYSRVGQLGQLNERPPVPDTLDWDLWLGPVQERAYHPMYVPGKWRGWSAFGSGIIGDWICHVVDPVFWALDLGAPETVQAEVDGYDPKQHGETFPGAVRVTYTFGSKGSRGPVTLHWYSGGKRMPRPDGLPEGQNVPDIGATVLGERGGIVYGSASSPRNRCRLTSSRSQRCRACRGITRISWTRSEAGRRRAPILHTAGRSRNWRCWGSSGCGSPVSGSSGTAERSASRTTPRRTAGCNPPTVMAGRCNANQRSSEKVAVTSPSGSEKPRAEAQRRRGNFA